MNGEYSVLFRSVMISGENPEGHGNIRAATETAPDCMECDPQEAGKYESEDHLTSDTNKVITCLLISSFRNSS